MSTSEVSNNSTTGADFTNKIEGELCYVPTARNSQYQLSHVGHNGELIYTFKCTAGFVREDGSKNGSVSCAIQVDGSLLWTELGNKISDFPDCYIQKEILIGAAVGLPLLLIILILSVLYARENRVKKVSNSLPSTSTTQLFSIPSNQNTLIKPYNSKSLPKRLPSHKQLRKSSITFDIETPNRNSFDDMKNFNSLPPPGFRPRLYSFSSVNKPLPELPTEATHKDHPPQSPPIERSKEKPSLPKVDSYLIPANSGMGLFKDKTSEITSHNFVTSLNHIPDEPEHEQRHSGSSGHTVTFNNTPMFDDIMDTDTKQNGNGGSYDNNTNWTFGRKTKRINSLENFAASLKDESPQQEAIHQPVSVTTDSKLVKHSNHKKVDMIKDIEATFV